MYYGDEDQNEIMKEIDNKYHDPLEELQEDLLSEEQKTKIAQLERQTTEKLKQIENEELPY